MTRIAAIISVVGLSVLLSIGLSAQERWIYKYNGPGNWYDEARSIVAGTDSNLYVAGSSNGIGTNDDFTVISLTSTGQERWIYNYNGLGGGYDEALSIVMGKDGNLYAAGSAEGPGTFDDFTVISLTSSGTRRWVYLHNGPGSEYDVANSIAVGEDSNVYAAGSSVGSEGGRDFVVISLAASGIERWVYRYNGPGNTSDEARSIIAGEDGNIYAAGYSSGSGTGYDFTVVSLTPLGSERWVYRYVGPQNKGDVANSILMGTDGNIYAAGYSSGSGPDLDFTIISLTPSGTGRWIYTYNGPGNASDRAESIVAGKDGNLYAVGASWGSGTSTDIVVVSITPSGGERWVYRFDGDASEDDAALSIAAGRDGNVYAAGYSVGSFTGYDFTVVSLTTAGTERWVYQYNGPGNDQDRASTIVTGVDDNLYAAGWSDGGWCHFDFTAISLGYTGLAETDCRPATSQASRLQPHPIPALANVSIYYSVPISTEISLSIYDVSGRLVRGITLPAKEPNSGVVLWDGCDHAGAEVPPGLYLCRLQADGTSCTKKLILLR